LRTGERAGGGAPFLGRRAALGDPLGSSVRFVKYHGLGNDFIVLLRDAAPTPDEARRLCARGFSIGADGVMVAGQPRLAEADVAMDLVNSDGSYPEMCGNGIRCLVKHAVDHLGHTANPLRVETPAGIRACAWTLGPDGKVASVRVEMGPARFALEDVPVSGESATELDGGELVVRLDGRPIRGTPVNTGNPHFVIFGSSARERALDIGPRLELHAAFPERANIELAEVVGDAHLRVTVWERGCGLTWACGTGATATAAAAIRRGLMPAGQPIRVTLPGGDLLITVAPDFQAAWMEGPASEAFRGVIEAS